MSTDQVGLKVRDLPPSALAEIIAAQNAIATAGLHLDDVMRIVAERSQVITGAFAAVIAMPEGDTLVWRAATGRAARHVGLRLAESSLSARCLQTGEVVCCADLTKEQAADFQPCRHVGARSLVIVPLVHEGVRVGVLKVMAPQPDAFSQGTVLALQVMAGLFASAMHNAELWDEKETALAEVQRVSRRNAELALSDALTGLGNRRAGEEALLREESRARRTGSALSLLLVDVDHFKRVNDDYGHAAGDLVLRSVASTIASCARAADVSFRWGGEEFLVLLADATLAGAAECAERMRARVAALELSSIADGHVTVCVGVGELSPEEGVLATLRRADDHLREAKAAGRNRVCF